MAHVLHSAASCLQLIGELRLKKGVNHAGIKQHSRPNEKLKAGLEAMGVHCAEIPRNCSREHGCGHCCFGCPSGDKQDATGTYLADATKAGAKIFTGGVSRFTSLHGIFHALKL